MRIICQFYHKIIIFLLTSLSISVTIFSFASSSRLYPFEKVTGSVSSGYFYILVHTFLELMVLNCHSGSAHCWRWGVYGVEHLTNWPNSVKPCAKPTPISGFPPISIFGIVLFHFHMHKRQCDS